MIPALFLPWRENGQHFALVFSRNFLLNGSVQRQLLSQISVSVKKGITDQSTRPETTGGFTQYPMAYLASAGLYCKNADAAWRIAKKTDEIITQPGVSTRYDQALAYNYDGKREGLPYYMTAPASWNMLEALAGLVADVSVDPWNWHPLKQRIQDCRCS